MTTIAYDGKSLATDSRSTIRDTIYDENSKKLFLNVGPFSAVAVSGDFQATTDLLEEVAGCTSIQQVRSLLHEDREGKGILIGVLYSGEAWSFDACDACVLTQGVPYAAGSGRDYAYAAMDLGLSAREAIVAASKRDVHTNNVVQVATFVTAEEASEVDKILDEEELNDDAVPKDETKH